MRREVPTSYFDLTTGALSYDPGDQGRQCIRAAVIEGSVRIRATPAVQLNSADRMSTRADACRHAKRVA